MRGKVNHIILNSKLLEYVDGELLGDGYIGENKNKRRKGNYGKVSSAFYRHSSKYKEYVEWLAQIFSSLGLEYGEIRKRIHKNTKSYTYTSRAYPELIDIRKRWYPNGKKIVPRDIKLTPIITRQWYIGDGHIDSDRHTPRISLFTCAFDISDVNFLKQELEKIGIYCIIWYHRKYPYLQINDKQAIINFFNYIGKCPEEIKDIYGYKWIDNGKIELLLNDIKKEKIMNSTYRNKEWIYNEYIVKKKSMAQIGKQLDVHGVTILKWMKRFGIPSRSLSESIHLAMYNKNLAE